MAIAKMETRVDTSRLRLPEDILGEDDEETLQLKRLHTEAEQFISRFSWCKRIVRCYFGDGVANLVGVFFFEIEPSSDAIDKFLWVIVGDLPPAYLVTDDAPGAYDALEGYIQQMERWVCAAENSLSLDGIIPVNVLPTKENGQALGRRLAFLRKEILPFLKRA